MIYKYCVGETFYFMRGEHGFWLFTQFKPGEWKPGEWHHVVCNWNPVQLSMYIDGRLVTEQRIHFRSGIWSRKATSCSENSSTVSNISSRGA